MTAEELDLCPLRELLNAVGRRVSVFTFVGMLPGGEIITTKHGPRPTMLGRQLTLLDELRAESKENRELLQDIP